MENSNKWFTAALLLGGVLMVVGAGMYCFMVARGIACWMFLAGALVFGVLQMCQKVPTDTLTLRRLKGIMTAADMLFILAGMLMVDTYYQWMHRFFTNYADYLQTVYNKWVLVLLIAALLETYSIHRIDSELKKQN